MDKILFTSQNQVAKREACLKKQGYAKLISTNRSHL